MTATGHTVSVDLVMPDRAADLRVMCSCGSTLAVARGEFTDEEAEHVAGAIREAVEHLRTAEHGPTSA